MVFPKDSPERATASTVAAQIARQWLETAGYDPARLDEIEHAIAAHSFSADIAPRTIEAKVVQDADRLDSLGAIGIARCLMLGGQLDRPLYDQVSTVDHFYTKLLLLADSMQTEAGRREAARRTEFMRAFLEELEFELDPSQES